jgi:hypothetical protein
MALDIERLVAEIDADPAKAIAALKAFQAASSAAAKDETKHIDVQVDRDRDLNVLSRVMASVTSGAGALTRGLRGTADAVTEAGSAAGGAGAGGFRGLGGAMGSAGGAMGPLVSMIGGVIGAMVILVPLLSVLPGMFSAAAAAAGALVGALAPLVGLLGAIPVGLGAIGGGIGAIITGFSGIGDAVGAMGDKAAEANPLMDTMSDRARQVMLAERGLRDAHRSAKEAAEALADAQRGLNEARKEAKEDLQQQRFTVRQALLSEKQAVLALRDAQERLTAAQQKTGSATAEIALETDYFTGKMYEVARITHDAVDQADDEAAAKLAVKQAELDLARARDHSKDSQRDLAEMERKGIKGSDQMVAAREALSDAQWGYKKALEGVADAEYALRQARKDATAATQQQSAATTALRNAMAALSPAGREFVRFLHDEFIPAWGEVKRKVQDAIIPGIHRGLEDLMGEFPRIGDRLADFGTTIGEGFADFMEFWTRPKRSNQLNDMFKDLNKTLGHMSDTAKPLSRVLVGITTSAGPMTNRILRGLNRQLDRLADWMESAAGKKKMNEFFKDAADFGGLWLDVLRPIGRLLGDIVVAAEPLARWMLKKMAGYFEDLADAGDTFARKKALKQWFEDQKPVLKELGELVVGITDLFFGSSKGGKDSAFYKMLVSINDDLLPKMKGWLEELDETTFAADLVTGLGDFVTFLQGVDWKQLSKDIRTLGQAIHGIAEKKNQFKKLQSGLDEFLDTIMGHGGKDNNKNPLHWLWAGIKKGYEGFDRWIKSNNFAKRWFEEIKTEWSKAWDRNVERFENFKTQMGRKVDSFKSWWDRHYTGWEGWGKTWDKLKESWGDAIQDLKDAWYGFRDWFGSLSWSDLVPDLKPKWMPKDDDGSINWIPGGDFSGGRQRSGVTRLVGEHGPELFTPSTSGTVHSTTETNALLSQGSNAPGVSDAQIDRVMRAIEDNRPISIDQTFTEKVDPMHVARELAWRLG